MKTQTGKNAIIDALEHYESARNIERAMLREAEINVSDRQAKVDDLTRIIKDLNAELAA